MSKFIITLVLILAIVILFIIYPLAALALIGILFLLFTINISKSGGGTSSSGSGKSSKQWSPKETGYGREKGRIIAQQGYIKYHIKEKSKWTLGLIIMFIIVFVGCFVYYTGLYKIGTTQAEEIGISSANLKNWLSFNYWQSKLTEFGSFKNPEATEQVVKKGVIFSNLESIKPYYFNKDKINILGDVHIDAIKDVNNENTPTKVLFSCKDDEGNIGKVLIYGVSSYEIFENLQEQQEVNVNEDMDIQFKCEIEPKGEFYYEGDLEKTCDEQGAETCDKTTKKCTGQWIKSKEGDCCKQKGNCVDLSTQEKAIISSKEVAKKIASNEIKYKSVYITAKYKDFITRSDLKICSISREELNENKDQYEKREEKAQCVSGCGLTRFAIETAKQPLNEEVIYFLKMGLVNDADWYGKIEKVNAIDIEKPNNIEFIGNCKESINEQINAVNDQITKSSDEKPRLNPFGCDYQFSDVDDKLRCSIIEVGAKYDYIVKGSTVVEVVNKEKA